MKIKKSDTVKVNTPESVAAADHKEAKECILSAIHILGNAAKADDKVAKEAIANLSVVLLDLK